MAEPLILVEGLAHTYLRGTPLEAEALRDVHLTVHEGQGVGIIGHTGSGKSTLLQHLNGLLRPQSGRVIVDGVNLSDPRADVRKVRQTVGLIFQRPEDQLFERYVGDDVAFGPRKFGLSREEVRERVRWALAMVGLDFEAFKDRPTFSLSGGEMRKVAIAGVLANRPRALVVDELTAGLDPRTRAELLGRLERWQAEEGLTLVMVSHNMDDLVRLTERLYVMVEGRTVLEGDTRQVFGQLSRLREWRLEGPRVTMAMRALWERGVPVRADALTVEEAEASLVEVLG